VSVADRCSNERGAQLVSLEIALQKLPGVGVRLKGEASRAFPGGQQRVLTEVGTHVEEDVTVPQMIAKEVSYLGFVTTCTCLPRPPIERRFRNV
jgi:hypothetical protein